MADTLNKTEKSASTKRSNRLAGETSSYLLQHAHNPVDWYPWGKEALDLARKGDRPILLSIGYSACHWCHVMEHESFEDPGTAELMNNHFVNIKVDREERPDLDEIYMKSVQMLTGHGGWPMTVFLTPDCKPFYAGTYFPPDDRHGIPSFKRVLLGIKSAWETQRQDVEESSKDICAHLNLLDKVKPGDSELTEELLKLALEPLLRVFDRSWGGFGGAPKFPHTASISFAMRRSKAGQKNKTAAELASMEMINTTLNRMAWGGIHDQLGGGFARYSVDRHWLIPHFEKMLYDNALIPRNYLDGFLLTGNEYWLQTAKDTLDFVLRELTTPEGMFYCSLDADSEGVEGKYYVWTQEEIKEVLGEQDGKLFCEIYGVSASGNFEHGSSVLNFPEGPEECRKKLGLSASEFRSRLNPLKTKLLEAREKRVRPGRDDKALTGWTGLMASALTDGFKVAGERRYLEAAKKAASFIIENLMKDGRLLRSYGRGSARHSACLDDYAYLIQALLDLASCDTDSRWIASALTLNKTVLEQFWDSEGGFYYTGADHEELIARSRHVYDGSTPSASSVSVMNLIRIARLTNNQELMQKAETALRLYSSFYKKAPDQFANMLCALDSYLAEPLEIAVVFDSASRAAAEKLLSTIYGSFLPGAVIALADLSAPDYEKLVSDCPLLKNRPLKNNRASVYICRNFSCLEPITEESKLKEAVHRLVAGSSS